MSDATLPQTSQNAMPGAARRAARYARYIFWLMFLLNLVNYLDRWIFTGLSPSIQRDLRLSDFQLGLLVTAFTLVYTIIAAPLGYLADRMARKSIVALGVAVWSLATAFTGLVSGFLPLLVVRSVVGVGEGSYYPAGTPMLAAYFSPAQRARVLARWGVGSLIGAAVGFLLATFFTHGSAWRLAFFFTGAPGLVLALLIFLTREKTRHEEDPRAARRGADAAAWWQRLRSYLRIPTVRVIIGLHALGFFALTGVTSFLTLFLSDTYGRVPASGASAFPHAGLSPALVPLVSGALVLVGGVAGNLYGGRLAGRLARRHSGARVLAGGLGFLLGAPCVAVAVGAPIALRALPVYAGASEQTRLTIGLGIFIVSALLAAFFLQVYSGPVSAALLDVVPPAERGTAGGMELTLAHLLGDVYAGALIGAISVALGAALGGEQIGLALVLTTPIALVGAGIVGIWGSRYYARDVERLGTSAAALLGTDTSARGQG